MNMNMRSTCVLLSRAARIIQRGADCLRNSHTTDGDWGDDLEIQQIHGQEEKTARELRALASAFIAPQATPIPCDVDPVRAALKILLDLKKHKDTHGKDKYYEEHQPAAWAFAHHALAGHLDGNGETVSSDVLDHCWKMYQQGQASADHTAKQVFAEVLQSFANWLRSRKGAP